MPIMLDLDGSLYNTTKRELKCQKTNDFWDCWFSAENLDLDTPNENVIELVKRLNEPVYIVSGRIEELQGEKTRKMLENLGLPIEGVFLKPQSWKYANELAFKARAYLWLLNHGILIRHVIDDSMEVLAGIARIANDFRLPQPTYWRVNSSVSQIEVKPSSRLGWVGLERADDGTLITKCRPYNILHIVRDNDGDYFAYALDCMGGPGFIDGFEVLTARVRAPRGVFNWVSPRVSITF